MNEKHQRIQNIVTAHLVKMGERRGEWAAWRAAADNHLWDQQAYPSSWSALMANKTFPVRVQVNTLRAWLEKAVGALYVRAPRVTVAAPAVRAAGAVGRPKSSTTQTLKFVCEAILGMQSIQDLVEHAFESALMYPGAALKVGYDDQLKGSPLDKLWVDVLQRWDVLWNEDAATLDRMTYIGHLRWEPAHHARSILGLDEEADLDDLVKSRAIQDFIDGTAMMDDIRTRPDTCWYMVLDWYDLECETFETFLVDYDGIESVKVICVREGEEESPPPIPDRLPNGRPLVPIFPLVLANSVGRPFCPVELARPIYEQGANKSLILTSVVNAFRRRTATVMLYLKKAGVSERDITSIMNAVDTEFVGLDVDKQTQLAELFAPMVIPDISNMLEKAYSYLSQAGQEGAMAMGGGQTEGMQYAPATAWQSIANESAAVITVASSRMTAVLGTMLEAMVSMLARRTDGLRVDVGDKTTKLSKSQLSQRWEIKVEDSMAAAAMDQARKAELLQAAGPYMESVANASSADAQVPKEVRVAAQLMVDLMCDAYDLPDTMRWVALRGTDSDVQPDKEAVQGLLPDAQPQPMPAPSPPPAQPMPEPAMVQGAPPAMTEDEILAVLQQMPPDQLQALLAMEQGG